jgi:hypothetical protein
MFQSDLNPPLPPPRFSLRAMLLGVTTIALYLGLTWWVSPVVMAGVTLAALAVGAHVAGNAIGTRMRERAPRREWVEPAPRNVIAEPVEHGTPATHLGERWSLGWCMLVPTLLGTAFSMVGGCYWAQTAYGGGIDAYGLAVAAVACGVLGGFASFLVATFCQVTAVAMRQALRHK